MKRRVLIASALVLAVGAGFGMGRASTMSISVSAKITDVGFSGTDPRGPAWLEASTDPATGRQVTVLYKKLAVAEVMGRNVGDTISVNVP